MKKFLLLCLVTFFSVFAWADEANELCFAVVEQNGEETYFAIEEEPDITFVDKTMTVKSASYTIENLPIDEILMCYITETTPSTNAIGRIATMDGASVELTNGKVLITGLKDGAQVYLYTADGQTIGFVTASIDGNVCVDISTLSAGHVYILRTPSTSYKIVK